jgi:hypothetical protein
MSIIDKLRARAAEALPTDTVELSPEQHALLAEWERADLALGGKAWTPDDREGATAIVQEIPDFRPTVIDLAKFGSIEALISRYEALLARCVSEGLLTPTQQTDSAKMARFGGISLASVIQEGKALKAWLDEEAERRALEKEFSAAWPEKAVSAE